MQEISDKTKKEAAGSRVIRRRARTVVASSIKGKGESEALSARPAGETVIESRGEESTSSTTAQVVLPAKPEASQGSSRPRFGAGASSNGVVEVLRGRRVPSGPSEKTPSHPTHGATAAQEPLTTSAPIKDNPYRAKIISRPVPDQKPPPGLPDLGDDDLARNLAATLVPETKPGESKGGRNDEGRKRLGKRRLEVNRRSLQEERDSFGRINRHKGRKKKAPVSDAKQTEITTPKAIKRVIRMADQVMVGDLAKRMGIKAGELITKLFEMGMMVTVNQSIDFDTTVLVCSEFEYEVQQTAFEEDSIIEEITDTAEELVPRAPIVTVMGHVDHGKTALLDAIRKSDVASGEAGGITQHIGAYEVKLDNGRKITFLDTPGHAAFTAMRARGAKITDIVILVVAGDDGVMPQTIEAISHAKAAEVPIIVAVNKMDKPGVDIGRIKKSLIEHELVPEEWGGTTLVAPVSAKTGQGLPELLESLALQAEIMELKANPKKRAQGVVIEARLEKGRGSVATLLISEGSLSAGDTVVIGQYFGRVRAMSDCHGRSIKTAGPSTPVEIQGIDGVPEAGDVFTVVKDEKQAKMVSEHRSRKVREHELRKTSRVSLDQLYAKIQEGDVRELTVIIKADVRGSAEALGSALKELTTDRVRLTVLHSSVGAITETDVNLASASNALLVGFNVRPEPKAKELAEKNRVELRTYTIIYNAIEDVRKVMEGKLAPEIRETLLGRAEVREIFRISKMGTIAGCMVVDGKIARSARVRLVRDGVTVHEGKISSLKRFKDDAREVASGLECGIGIEGYNDVQPSDVIEAFLLEEFAAKL